MVWCTASLVSFQPTHREALLLNMLIDFDGEMVQLLSCASGVFAVSSSFDMHQ